MSEPVDLWGDDFDVSDIIPPVTVLKEQAALLGKKTQQLVRAEVETTHSGVQIRHSLTLVAPALDDYRYNLFTSSHTIELYPVDTYFNGNLYKSNNGPEFIGDLKTILSSPETQKVVKALLAQSKS